MRNRTLAAAAALAAAALLVSGCASTPTSSPAPGARTSTAAAHAARSKTAAINACYKRPWATGQIYVRTVVPGLATTAQEYGGEWSWDYTTGQCTDSADMMIETAPTGPGYCTQVALAADNPGYDAGAAPAAPLKHLIDSAGPAC